MYRKLKRTWRNGYIDIPKFKTIFPELSRLDDDELEKRFEDLNMTFFYEEKKPVHFLIRLTLPFAIVVMLLMLIVSPITFLINGRWGYSLGKSNVIFNWFRSLKLL